MKTTDALLRDRLRQSVEFLTHKLKAIRVIGETGHEGCDKPLGDCPTCMMIQLARQALDQRERKPNG